MDTKTLIALIVGVALLIASFFFGRATVHVPVFNADTVTVHHYTTVETSFNLDAVPAYLHLKNNNAKLQSVNLRLQRYSDSLQKFIDEPEQIIAALDTLLDDSSSLNIQYLFPPINSFLIDYRARPIYNSIDTIFISKKIIEIVKRDGLWLNGLTGYGQNVALGFSIGYSWGGIGIVLVGNQNPIYTLNYHYSF